VLPIAIGGALVVVTMLSLAACSSPAEQEKPSKTAGEVVTPTPSPSPQADAAAAEAPQTAAPLPTEEATVGETVAFDTGVSVVIDAVESTSVEAKTPGEVSGSAVVVKVTARNESDAALSLDSAVVTLSSQDGEPGIGTTAGDPKPLAGSLEPGSSATGRYVFMLDSAAGRPVSVSVNYAAGQPVAVFTGKAS
jgi:hypothetical protein